MEREEIIRRLQAIEDEMGLSAVPVPPWLNPLAESYITARGMTKALREELEREVLAEALASRKGACHGA